MENNYIEVSGGFFQKNCESPSILIIGHCPELRCIAQIQQGAFSDRHRVSRRILEILINMPVHLIPLKILQVWTIRVHHLQKPLTPPERCYQRMKMEVPRPLDTPFKLIKSVLKKHLNELRKLTQSVNLIKLTYMQDIPPVSVILESIFDFFSGDNHVIGQRDFIPVHCQHRCTMVRFCSENLAPQEHDRGYCSQQGSPTSGRGNPFARTILLTWLTEQFSDRLKICNRKNEERGYHTIRDKPSHVAALNRIRVAHSLLFLIRHRRPPSTFVAIDLASRATAVQWGLSQQMKLNILYRFRLHQSAQISRKQWVNSCGRRFD